MHRRTALRAALWLPAAHMAGLARANGGEGPPPALPDAQPLGQGLYRYFGFSVYTATLWVQTGFSAADFAAHPFALELRYRRDFRGRDIARRSLDEMRPLAEAGGRTLAPELATAWLQRMEALFPDVQEGDRIVGLNLPARGARFYFNGQPLGTVEDASFAAHFFGIWLAPGTSAPRLREALLGIAAPKS